MAGIVLPSSGNNYGTPISPTSMFGNPGSFSAAASQQASDYDNIMAMYKNLADSYSSNPISAPTVNAPSITPQLSQYNESPDVNASLSKLSDLATTGGYSAGDIQNIRERDISPIRSIYANARQNLERQRALSGGYSPNFNAVMAQTARDEAQKIGDVTTAANAGIAQNVASNKIATAPAYASASASENAARTAADQRNADIVNQINSFNANNNLQTNEFNTTTGLNTAFANRAGPLNAAGGMTSLYGTSPALVRTFGDQVVQAGQLGQNQQQINNNNNNNMLRMFLG